MNPTQMNQIETQTQPKLKPNPNPTQTKPKPNSNPTKTQLKPNTTKTQPKLNQSLIQLKAYPPIIGWYHDFWKDREFNEIFSKNFKL